MRSRFLSVTAVLLAFSSMLVGQQATCHQQAFAVSVSDNHGHFVPSLDSANFRARLNAADLKIASLESRSSAHRVVIALDASGSMESEIRQRVLQQVSSEIVRSSPLNTEFGLVVFTDRVLETVQFGHSREEVLWAVDHLILPAHNKTALRDALLNATTLFGTTQPGDSVVVVTDGGDNISKASAGTVESAFRSHGLRLLFVRLYDHYFKPDTGLYSSRETSTPEVFETLAETVGGAVLILDPPDSHHVIAIAHAVADQLAHYYVLTMVVPESLDKPSPLRMEIVGAGGKKMKNIGTVLPGKMGPCVVQSEAR